MLLFTLSLNWGHLSSVTNCTWCRASSCPFRPRRTRSGASAAAFPDTAAIPSNWRAGRGYYRAASRFAGRFSPILWCMFEFHCCTGKLVTGLRPSIESPSDIGTSMVLANWWRIFGDICRTLSTAETPCSMQIDSWETVKDVHSIFHQRAQILCWGRQWRHTATTFVVQ